MDNSGTLFPFMNDIKPEEWMVFTKVSRITDLYWIWFPPSSGFPPALPGLPWLGRRPRGHRQPPHKQAGGAHTAGGELPLENEDGGDDDQASWKQIKDDARFFYKILMMKLLRLCDTVIISSLLNCPFRSVIAFKALPSPTTYGHSESIS